MVGWKQRKGHKQTNVHTYIYVCMSKRKESKRTTLIYKMLCNEPWKIDWSLVHWSWVFEQEQLQLDGTSSMEASCWSGWAMRSITFRSLSITTFLSFYTDMVGFSLVKKREKLGAGAGWWNLCSSSSREGTDEAMCVGFEEKETKVLWK